MENRHPRHLRLVGSAEDNTLPAGDPEGLTLPAEQRVALRLRNYVNSAVQSGEISRVPEAAIVLGRRTSLHWSPEKPFPENNGYVRACVVRMPVTAEAAAALPNPADPPVTPGYIALFVRDSDHQERTAYHIYPGNEHPVWMKTGERFTEAREQYQPESLRYLTAAALALEAPLN